MSHPSVAGPGAVVTRGNLPKMRGGRHAVTMDDVKFRIGTVVAFGVGYVLGSKAGRERYQQITRIAGDIGRSAPVAGTVGVAGDKAKAVATLSAERLRDAVATRLGWRDGDDAADAIAQTVAEDLASALNGQRGQKPDK